jgi:HK97 gp10 family phage protein
MIELKISGLADLKKVLDELPAKIEKNVMRGALRAGGNVIADEARRIAPEAPPTMDGVKRGARIGELRRSIRVTLRMRGKSGWINAQIKAGNKVAWYAQMVEFGTARHWIKPKNRKSLFFAGIAREVIDHPGARPKPFMRPALDTKAQAAIEAMADYIRKRLPRELKKQGMSE